MNEPVSRRRRRGAFLSTSGYRRYVEARRFLDDGSNPSRASLERLADAAGIATRTVSRVLRRESPVDVRTLELLFEGVGLDLETQDYVFADIAAAASFVPPPRNPFFGREALMVDVGRLFERTRVVTIVGAGGIGKSRFTAELIASGRIRSERVVFVDLSFVTDHTRVQTAILEAFGGRRERSRGREFDLRVGEHSTLLLLDNCEHVIEEASRFADTALSSEARLSIIATSREPLEIAGEAVVRIPPLSVGDGVALFADRAASGDSVRPFDSQARETVRDIVVQLDGVPLAIELAAGRASSMSLEELRDGLRDSLRVLQSTRTTGPERHRSVALSISWSYALLDSEERRVLRRLAPFMGGFTAAAAVVVCSDGVPVEDVENILRRLALKSLLLVDVSSAVSRFRLLESVRQFAAERLREAGEYGWIALRHAVYYRGLAASLREAAGVDFAAGALRVLLAERFNLDAALTWTIGGSENAHLGAAIAAELADFWDARGTFEEGEECIRSVLDLDTTLVTATTRAKLLEGLALMAYRRADVATAGRAAHDATTEYALSDDRSGVLRARNLQAAAAFDSGDVETARTILLDNLFVARRHYDARAETGALNDLGRISAEFDKEFDVALDRFAESLVLAEAAHLSTTVMYASANCAEASLQLGQSDKARAYLERALETARELENAPMISMLTTRVLTLAIREHGIGAVHAARASAIEALERNAYHTVVAPAVDALAEALLERDEPERAAILLFATARESTPVVKSVAVARRAALLQRTLALLPPETASQVRAASRPLDLQDAVEIATASEFPRRASSPEIPAP